MLLKGADQAALVAVSALAALPAKKTNKAAKAGLFDIRITT
jgi:hypothetical protein